MKKKPFERPEKFIERHEIFNERKKYRLNGCEILMNGLIWLLNVDYQWGNELVGWLGVDLVYWEVLEVRLISPVASRGIWSGTSDPRKFAIGFKH